MKIILSPSKEMDFKNKLDSSVELNDITKSVLNELKSKTKSELQKLLKVSEKISDEVYDYYNNFERNKSYYAIDMYNGMAFKEMDFDADNSYAREHVVILSAFYGCLSVEDKIKPYRLDFNTSIKVNGESLKKLWSDYYNKYFKKGEMILNLASDEFSSILDRERFNFIDFDFYELKDGNEKRHSTISKKMRGKMANFLVHKEVENLETIKEFKEDGYVFDVDSSNDKLFVFKKET